MTRNQVFVVGVFRRFVWVVLATAVFKLLLG